MTSGNYKKSIPFKPFKSVLIANRGEIAVRITRACRDMGLQAHAVYSTADLNSKHVAMADRAVCIGEGPSSESYLHMERIIAAAKEMASEAVHPGFGFLSENPDFAQMVVDAGLVWIGPSPWAIKTMGDKTMAKQLVSAAGVPCSPGRNEPLKNVAELQQIANEVGYPLILKAAAGGGGRGMRVVREDGELKDSFEACQREAQSYFNNPDVFCERFIDSPRHVEIQIIADGKGNTVHLYERDCTIQRRHQKLLEEAPSSFLSKETRRTMGELAVKAAESVNYTGAGTVEFIMESPEKYYFMEMNTRIQVEHPVTECITGIDLVQQQIKVAMGEALSFKQEDVKIRGWAFEARINAEDALQDFRPDPGKITQLELPAGPGVRVDTHIYPGYKIPEFYDSMIAKLIVYGTDRNDALAKLRRALGELHIEGITTTANFHRALTDNKQIQEGVYTTKFIEENPNILSEFSEDCDSMSPEEALLAVLNVAKENLSPQLSHKNQWSEAWQRASRKEGIND